MIIEVFQERFQRMDEKAFHFSKKTIISIIKKLFTQV